MAKRFKFRLDKLLEIRKDKEEESKRLFNKEQRKKLSMEEKLNDLNHNYEKYKGISPNEDVVFQKLKRYYVLGLQEGIKQTEKELIKQNMIVEKRRAELKQKQIERKTVEILKDKKYDEYIKEENRVEQNTIDEIALYAYMRNDKV